MPAPRSVADYLAGLPADRRAALEGLRRTILAAAPEAAEGIAYRMPALRSHGGQFLVSYAAFRRHYSLFPASAAVVEALGADLADAEADTSLADVEEAAAQGRYRDATKRAARKS